MSDGLNKVMLIERFLKKVDMSGDCWVWTGSLARGYGQLSTHHGAAPMKAHRISYELFVGLIPKSHNVLHHCDNPPCVRPTHLFVGTQADNIRDASSKGRLNDLSLLNLRPGARGYHGAGPLSRKEMTRV